MSPKLTEPTDITHETARETAIRTHVARGARATHNEHQKLREGIMTASAPLLHIGDSWQAIM